MKEIKAFVKPFKVMDIFHHLKEAGFSNLTVSIAEGTGRLTGEEASVSTRFSITDSQVAKIEIVCSEQEAEDVIHLIGKHGKTGNPGDGIIYVSDVEKVYRIKDI